MPLSFNVAALWNCRFTAGAAFFKATMGLTPTSRVGYGTAIRVLVVDDCRDSADAWS